MPGRDECLIRLESGDDAAEVERAVTSAFGGTEEARLVELLRGQDGVFSFVALCDGAVAGHVMFSPITGLTRDPALRGVGLAPMAVRPDRQRQGIGSALVRRGIDECRARGLGLVVVLGHPGYYPRFGFVPAARFGIRCKWSKDDGNFMAIELTPGHAALAGGFVHYHAEFDRF